MEEVSFFPLLLIVLLAFAVPMLLTQFRRLRLPIVVGEILAGIVVGRSGLNLIPAHDPVLDLLAEFGFVFLMFLSGLEIDFSNISLPNGRGSRPKMRLTDPLPLGLVGFGLTLGLSTLIGLMLAGFDLVTSPWLMALILSTTSLGVVLPVLKERGLSTGRFGQTILISALVADFVTMILITVLVAAMSHGLTLDVLLIGGLFLAFVLIYRVGNLFFNRVPGVRRTMEELSHATAQIKVRAAFGMMLIFVVLSEFLGAEVILGSFMAGAMVSLLRTSSDSDLSHQLESIGFGFFIPIFFIKVGIDFNLKVLLSSPQSLLLVPILLVAALLVKYVPMLLYRYIYNWRQTLAAGSLLSARLSLIIAASAIGLRLGVVDETVNSAIILVAVLTVTFAPILFNRILPEQEQDEHRPIVIAGMGALGRQVARTLRAHHEVVVGVDSDIDRLEDARRDGFEVIPLNGPFEENAALNEVMEKAQTVVGAFDDADDNYRISCLAKHNHGIDHIIAQVSGPGDLLRFEQLGVTTMNAALDRANLLSLMVRNPALYELITRTDDDKEIVEFEMFNPECNGKRLSDLKLPGDVVIVALRRGDELLIPHGNTALEMADHLTLAGSVECLGEIHSLFNC